LPEIEVYAPGTSLGKRDMLIGGAFFEQSIRLKIKGDPIPEAVAEEIIGELQALFATKAAPGQAGAALWVV
jgi:hypothetical protein